MTEGKKVVVFLTPEVAIDQSLHTYSGGLGVMSGDFLRSARKIGLPVVGMTFLPREGYYDQEVNGWGMRVEYRKRYYEDILEKTGIKFTISICGSPVWLEILRLPEGWFDTVPVYFLDADIPENDHVSRLNTIQLYGGSIESGTNVERVERKVAQSIVLGRGCLEAVNLLGIRPKLYHVNESHAGLLPFELFSNFVFKEGMTFEQAKSATRLMTIFTTHTPVDAGNPKYDFEVMAKLGGYNREFLRFRGWNYFDMAGTAMFLSGKVSAVSKRHLDIAKRLWHWVDLDQPMVSVTNGVSQDYWQYSEFRSVNTPQELQSAKTIYKSRMTDLIKERTGKKFAENVLTVIWARRFAEYKRPKLLFHYFDEWLLPLLIEGKLQLIVAGKPHPDDRMMIDVWNDIYKLSLKYHNLAVLSGYELGMSKVLKAGADGWLNTPRAPYEACGTSGMSAAMNGAINISTPDGWMCEANPENCFLFGARDQVAGYSQDAFDATDLRETINNNVITLYYQHKDGWYRKALAGKLEVEKKRTSDRMAREYAEKLYDFSR